MSGPNSYDLRDLTNWPRERRDREFSAEALPRISRSHSIRNSPDELTGEFSGSCSLRYHSGRCKDVLSDLQERHNKATLAIQANALIVGCWQAQEVQDPAHALAKVLQRCPERSWPQLERVCADLYGSMSANTHYLQGEYTVICE